MDTIISYFLICWQKKLNYQGRARRLEFWSFLLVNLIIFTGLQTTEMLIKGYIYSYPDLIYFTLNLNRQENDYLIQEPFFIFHTLAVVYFIISLIPLLSVTARRLQDLNKSKYWIFYLSLPVILILISFILIMLVVYFDMPKPPSLNLEGYENYIFTVLGIYLLYYLFLVFKLLFQEGEPEENKYGKPPKEIDNI